MLLQAFLKYFSRRINLKVEKKLYYKKIFEEGGILPIEGGGGFLMKGGNDLFITLSPQK